MDRSTAGRLDERAMPERIYRRTTPLLGSDGWLAVAERSEAEGEHVMAHVAVLAATIAKKLEQPIALTTEGPMTPEEAVAHPEPTMVKVTAYQCPYTPEDDPPAPIGMYHCPVCGCMVVSRMPHGACFRAFCPALEGGTHPGPEIEVEINADDVIWLS
jgi:hypothetical protein